LRPLNPLSLADVISKVMNEAYTNERSSSHISVHPPDELRAAFDQATKEVAEKVSTGRISTPGGTTLGSSGEVR